MARSLPPGLYERVVTEGFREQLQAANNHVRARITQLDPDEAHEFLGLHLHTLLRSALKAYSQKERLDSQVGLSNRILDVLAAEFPGEFTREDYVTQQILEALFPAKNAGLPDSTPRPGIPLSQSELLVNAHDEYRVGYELDMEIRSADRIDLLCSFIKWSGLRLLRLTQSRS